MIPNPTQETKLEIFFKQQLKTMSFERLERWKNSPTGLLFQIQILGRENSRSHQSRLELCLASQRQSCWEWACEKAWGWDWESRRARLALGSRQHLEEAERLCVSKLYAPPHYRVVSECEACGVVLLKAKNQTCPWCVTFLNPSVREKAWQLVDRAFESPQTYHPPLPELARIGHLRE